MRDIVTEINLIYYNVCINFEPLKARGALNVDTFIHFLMRGWAYILNISITLSIYLSIYLSKYISIYLYLYLYLYLFVCVCVCVCVRVRVCAYVCLYVLVMF